MVLDLPTTVLPKYWARRKNKLDMIKSKRAVYPRED